MSSLDDRRHRAHAARLQLERSRLHRAIIAARSSRALQPHCAMNSTTTFDSSRTMHNAQLLSHCAKSWRALTIFPPFCHFFPFSLLETQVEHQLRSNTAAALANSSSSSLIVAASGSTPPPPPPSNPTVHFTLRRLLVWVQEPMQRLSLLAMLADSARGVRGGCLASVIGAHMKHGDEKVVATVKRIMRKV